MNKIKTEITQKELFPKAGGPPFGFARLLGDLTGGPFVHGIGAVTRLAHAGSFEATSSVPKLLPG
ncbi:hypothetical protein [Actinomadura graeca]|uniref:hypothetical protein n=1 Tax=Actinomadura graeca TaxID=2750812 RepID=UPI001E635121|nr:hypothetical protein [Actinomadura graeca]